MKRSTSITIIISLIAIIIILAASLAFFLFQNRQNAQKTDGSSPESITSSPETIPGTTKPYNFDYSWVEKGPYIAHALGGVEGSNYSNSYEAFIENYAAGHRLFEADFTLTNDGDVVLMHSDYEWQNRFYDAKEPAPALTTRNFLTKLYDKKFHALDYRELIDLLIEHPDAYLITDSKYTDQARIEQEFNQIIEYAKSRDSSVLDRFIIQIYNPAMLDTIMELYPWRSVIYTLYQDPDWTIENVINFAQNSGVKVITIACNLINSEISDAWNSAGLTIAAFTTSNLNEVSTLYNNFGVKLFYTDFLLPYTTHYITSPE